MYGGEGPGMAYEIGRPKGLGDERHERSAPAQAPSPLPMTVVMQPDLPPQLGGGDLSSLVSLSHAASIAQTAIK